MKIGFIFPNKDRRYKTMHLGMAYLAAYARLHHQDLEFVVLDTRVASRADTKKFFNQSFDLIGMTVFAPVYAEVTKLYHRIRETHKNTPIVIGGPYVTTIKQEIFEDTPADFAVYGEGEQTFNELIHFLKGTGTLTDIKGLMYKDQSGEIIINPDRTQFDDLNTLPRPAYDIFPMEKYPLHRLVTSRGCPYSCAWCNSSSLWGGGNNRTLSAEKMVAEVEFLISEYGKKMFVFGDNSFNADLDRVDKFCDLLIEKDIQILWAVSLRADIMTQEIANKMKKAGCFNVSIGIESANNKILSKIRKGTTIEKVTEGISMLKKAGIEIMSQYVIGSPYETLETVKESIEYAKNSECDYVNFYTILPFKGTMQWSYIEEHGKLYYDKIHDFFTVEPRIVFDTPEFSYDDRLEAIKLVTKEGFYSNKDTRSFWFDLAKDTSRNIQKLLPKSVGEKLYLVLKSVYKLRLVKKNNR